jgi:small-conductance mechanosensitive channel
MKLAGMLLLLAGWGIVVSAVALFSSSGMRELFVLAGLGVELLGLTLAFRGAKLPREAK